MEQSIIAERLTALRKEAGISQAKVAETLRVSRQAVSKWESGKAAPSLAVYAALASLYRKSPDVILTGEEYRPLTSALCEGESFSDRLRSLRTDRGISQGELAEALEVSRQSVSKWERGEAEPDADRLIALSRILDAPIACLLFCPPTYESAEEDLNGISAEKKSGTSREDEAPAEEEKSVSAVTADTSSLELALSEENAFEPDIDVDDSAGAHEKTSDNETSGAQTNKTHRSPIAEKRLQKMKAHVTAIRRKKKKAAEEAAKAEKKADGKIPVLSANRMAYIYVDKEGGKVHTVLPFLAALPLGVAAVALMLRKKK